MRVAEISQAWLPGPSDIRSVETLRALPNFVPHRPPLNTHLGSRGPGFGDWCVLFTSVEGRGLVPTVGRVVHYVSYGTPGGEYSSACRAAVVTYVGNTTRLDEAYVHLCVLNPEGMFFNRDCIQDEAGRNGGTWHWPERD